MFALQLLTGNHVVG